MKMKECCKQEKEKTMNKVLTVPNLLSAFRIALLPLFVWIYGVKENYIAAGWILILSGVTDIADGFIARHFHMVSNVGKILDPIADKMTQGIVLICLIFHFPLMLAPLALMALKEIFVGSTGLMVIRRTGHVFGANWHGKIVTCLLDAMLLLHIVWYDIPSEVSNTTIVICIVMMLVSLILYGVRNMRALKEKKVTRK